MVTQVYPVYSTSAKISNEFALSGSADATIKLWNINSGECLKTFKGHLNVVSSLLKFYEMKEYWVALLIKQ